MRSHIHEQRLRQRSQPQFKNMSSLIQTYKTQPTYPIRKTNPKPQCQLASQFFINLNPSIAKIQSMFTDVKNNLIFKQQLRVQSIQITHLCQQNSNMKDIINQRNREIQRMGDVIRGLEKKVTKIESIKNIRFGAKYLKISVDEFKRKTINQINSIHQEFFAQILGLKQMVNSKKQVQSVIQKIPKSNEKILQQKINTLKQQQQKLKRNLYQIYETLSYYMNLPKPQTSNFIQKLPQYQKSIISYFRTNKFLSQSLIITDLQSRKWLMAEVRSINCDLNESVTSKLIYKYDKMNKTNFHHYFDNIPNILILVKAINGYIIGGYTQYPFRIKKGNDSNGMLFNLLQKSAFPIRDTPHCEVTKYDQYYFILGNSELRIKNGELKLFSNFGVSTSVFDNKGKSKKDFYGQNESEIDIEGYEIYELQ